MAMKWGDLTPQQLAAAGQQNYQDFLRNPSLMQSRGGGGLDPGFSAGYRGGGGQAVGMNGLGNPVYGPGGGGGGSGWVNQAGGFNPLSMNSMDPQANRLSAAAQMAGMSVPQYQQRMAQMDQYSQVGRGESTRELQMNGGQGGSSAYQPSNYAEQFKSNWNTRSPGFNTYGYVPGGTDPRLQGPLSPQGDSMYGRIPFDIMNPASWQNDETRGQMKSFMEMYNNLGNMNLNYLTNNRDTAFGLMDRYRLGEESAFNMGLAKDMYGLNAFQANALAGLQGAQGGLYGAQADQIYGMLPYEQRYRESQTGLNQAQGGLYGAQGNLANAQAGRVTGLLPYEQENLAAQTGATQAQGGLYGAQANQITQMTPHQIANLQAQTGATQAQGGLYGAQAQAAIAQAGLYGSQAGAAEAQGGLYGAQAQQITGMLPYEQKRAQAETGYTTARTGDIGFQQGFQNRQLAQQAALQREQYGSQERQTAMSTYGRSQVPTTTRWRSGGWK